MARKEEVFSRLRRILRDGDVEAVKPLMEELKRVNPMEVLDVCTDEMRKIGKEFERGDLYLPDVMVAAEVMREIASTLTPKLKRKRKFLGRVVIGTVQGDIHDLGKNIVAALLEAEGFQVFNLGKDVPAKVFVREARRVNADVVGASALMTTTMLEQQRLAEEIRKAKLKAKYIVGGAPVTDEWAEKIGADARGEDALDAVVKVKKLLGVD
ncbi:MAG: cobalamin B12-binding domain-containing protein [Candidatus Hecatellaceae archaeon]